MAENELYSIVPYSGELDRVDMFYNILGIQSNNGIVRNCGFEIVYGRKGVQFSKFQFVIEVDADLDNVEKELRENDFRLVDSGFDGAGPFLLVEDPSGMVLRVGEGSAHCSKTK